MSRAVALVRGINVGGHRKVPMADLRRSFEGLGCTGVETYLQSGNVVFETRGLRLPDLAAAIEHRVAADFATEVSVLVRTGTEMARLERANPFRPEGADESTLHVTFLADRPKPASVRALEERSGTPDAFVVRGREVFLHCPGGYGRTKLTNGFFERHLGVTATTRNWRTVTKLCELTKT
ncbi:MAG: DUF1697 domain-containing protein [Acidimicrobiia bacterium]|nr:DUF1697 domain-containing protein [Acidimicrobiia bacterium]